MYRLLLIEPNATIATALRAVLEQNDFTVDHVSEPADLRRRDLAPYAVMIVDVQREPRQGLDEIAWLHQTRSDLVARILVITADDPESIRDALHTAGVCDVLVKPLRVPEIVQAVQECLERNPEYAVH